MVSSNPSVNQADDCDDEMMYNENKRNRYRRRGSQHTTYSNHDDTTSHIHIHLNMPNSERVDTNDSKADSGDDKSDNCIYQNRNGRQGSRQTGEIHNTHELSTPFSVQLDTNDRRFHRTDAFDDNFTLQSRNESHGSATGEIYSNHEEIASCDNIHFSIPAAPEPDTSYSTFNEEEIGDESSDKKSNSSESESDQMSTTTEQSNDEDVRTSTHTLPDTHV